MIEIRRVTDADSDESDQIWLQAFQAGTFNVLRSLREGREAYGDRIVRFGLWDAVGMQASFQMFDNQTHYGSGSILPTAYISSVAVRPAARGRGYGHAVLRHMLEHMRDQGQVFVTLVPFSYDYYGALGWEWMCPTRSYRVSPRILPFEPANDKVRAATKADYPGIRTMYARFAEKYRGMSVRDDAEWNVLLGDTSERETYSYLFEGEGGVEGYFAFSGGSGQEVSLTEFLTLNAGAQRALLGLIRRFHMQTKSIVWEAPEDDGLWSQIMSRQLETTIQPACIGRVVDIVAALGALRPLGLAAASMTICIHDPGTSWNGGTKRVTIEAGIVSVQPVCDEPEISMDIKAFSQSFMGALPLAVLRQRNRIEVRSETAFQTLRQLLDGPPMWAIGPI